MTLALFQMSSVPSSHEELDFQEAAPPVQTPYDVPMSPGFEWPVLRQTMPSEGQGELIDHAIWDIVLGEEQPLIATTPRSVTPTDGYMPLSPLLDRLPPNPFGSPPDLRMELDTPSVSDSAEARGASAPSRGQIDQLEQPSGASDEHVPPSSLGPSPGPDAPNQVAPGPEVSNPDVCMLDASGVGQDASSTGEDASSTGQDASDVGSTSQQLPSLHWLGRVKRAFPPQAVPRWRDALVAYEPPHHEYIITSPNMRWIPEAPYGVVRVVRQKDGHFGASDPILWPQMLVPSPSYRWLSAVRRTPKDPGDPSRPIWIALGEEDVEPVRDSFTRSFGVVSEAFRSKLKPLVDKMTTRVGEFTKQCGKIQALSTLAACMTDAFDRLDFPSTTRDLIRQVAAVQRYWLLADAWIEFHVYLFPSFSFDEPSDRERAAIREDLMGAFTELPDAAQLLMGAGIPVWMIRLSASFRETDVVLDLVPPVSPSFVSDSGPFAPTPIYAAWAGELHLRAIAANAHVYADLKVTPYPSLLSASSQLSEASLEAPPRLSDASHKTSSKSIPSESSKRYHPYKNTPSEASTSRSSMPRASSIKTSSAPKHKIAKLAPGERDKFQDFEHPRLPATLPAWRSALAGVDQTKTAPVRTLSWLYYVPDPAAIASANEDRFARYMGNWVRARASWLYVLSHFVLPPISQTDLRALKSQEWRDYMNGVMEDNAQKNTHAAGRTRAVHELLAKAFGSDHAIDPTVELTWYGSPWSPNSLQQTREILWEISEIGFRFELLALDRHLVSSDGSEQPEMLEISRRQLIQTICAGRPEFLSHLPTANEGLASPNICGRARSLEALRTLVSRWPSVPVHIATSKPLTEVDATTLAKMEVSLCRFYAQTFWQEAGRAATIPRMFPIA
ncbi:hypothetical protein EIP86_003877 [Pleurotus ostreatoroseus]|nr:hypothetical protein EIP86_003877 [Pleurotus ostreatoroseus]